MLRDEAFTRRLVKLLPAWLISQCFISVRKDVKWNPTETVHCTHTLGPNTVTGSAASEMAETHGLMIVLLIFLEKLLLTHSKGIVTLSICSYSLHMRALLSEKGVK